MTIVCFCPAVGERVTVAKLQVGLLGSARTLQKQLDRIASRADTNSPSGLHYILQGVLPPVFLCCYKAAPVFAALSKPSTGCSVPLRVWYKTPRQDTAIERSMRTHDTHCPS